MEVKPLTPKEMYRIIVRRKWWLIIPLVACFLFSLILALILPPEYKSTSTILVEQQNISPDYVKMADVTYVEQQLQMINQRIMTSSKLLGIINSFNLYPEMRRKSNNTDDLLDEMRQDITLEPINTEYTDPRTGKSGQIATIAFTLSYESKGDPSKVQRVAKELAALFLKENGRLRQSQATELTGFLNDEAKKLKNQIDQIDARMAQFKQRHVNDLPEVLQANTVEIHEIERSIDQVNTKLTGLGQKRDYLKTQLAGTSPEFKEAERQHLGELKVTLADLKNRFSEEHPDVIKTRAEMAVIEKQLQSRGSSGKQRPDNPAYIALSSELSGVQSEISSTNMQLRDLNSRLMEYKRRISASPQVESEYRSLVTERDNIKAKYDDLMKKAMDARVSQGLGEKQNWERFTLIDPARVPEKPDKPNKVAILLIGIALGISAGIGGMSVREYTDYSVRDVWKLAEATSSPVLASIPVIVTQGAHKKANARQGA